jgi:Protein of unknown function (DUF3311)
MPPVNRASRSRWRHLILLLLVVPFIGTLWVSSYARTSPTLLGFPFFYWYQFLWIAISAVLTLVVYLVERTPAPRVEDSR